MGTSLFYRATGGDQAKTILFLHGGGVAGWMWDSVVERLPDFHCLIPDMPEHGRSMDIKPFSIRLAADEALALIREQAHGGRAIVVGLSEGAQVTVQMLATDPVVIEKALISSALLVPMAGYRWLLSPGLLAWMFRVSVPPFRSSEWWMRLNMKYSAAIPSEFFPQYRENFQIMNESQFVNLILANQRYRLPSNLGNAIVPTLVIGGKREYAVIKKSIQLLAAALPNAQSRLVDLGKDASMNKEHNWAMNAPDLFVRTVRNFIEGGSLPEQLLPLE